MLYPSRPIPAVSDLNPPTIHTSWPHRIHWTRDAFATGNTTLLDAFAIDPVDTSKLLVVVEQAVVEHHPQLPAQIKQYAQAHALPTPEPIITLPGAEQIKDGMTHVNTLLEAIQDHGIDRRSYILAIGGGALLDMVGFAAGIAHRGVRLIRVPTTTLSQCDSGVGVKNAVNLNGEKNFIGTFQVPWAVVNDAVFLDTLPTEVWREGLSEAVKVALLKDPDLFNQLEASAAALKACDAHAGQPVWQRTADLHVDHITQGGDPFEEKRARPLDFGHWAAHRLEQLSGYRLPHGQAVAIGLAIDIQYAAQIGLLDPKTADRSTALLQDLGFSLWHASMLDSDALLHGIERFRQHLGGQLTITLIKAIGQPLDVHTIDAQAMRSVIAGMQPASPVSL